MPVPNSGVVPVSYVLTRLVYVSCAADAGGAQLHTVGLLVVEATVPGSPADGVLEPGDVLVRVQGQVCTSGADVIRELKSTDAFDLVCAWACMSSALHVE
jgi:S1-C subfamily serine protease